MPPLRFTAHVITGSGRGKTLKVPTINVDLADVPRELQEGIYACWVTIEEKHLPGALHYGPRPVFGDTQSCEVHVIDGSMDRVEDTVVIEIVGRVRDVRDFPSQEALLEEIQRDITTVRGILDLDGLRPTQTADLGA